MLLDKKSLFHSTADLAQLAEADAAIPSDSIGDNTYNDSHISHCASPRNIVLLLRRRRAAR